MGNAVRPVTLASAVSQVPKACVTPQESAFWSKHLYEAAALRSLIFCGVLAAAALIPLFVIVFAGPGEVGVAVARIAVVLLAFGRLGPARASAPVARGRGSRRSG